MKAGTLRHRVMIEEPFEALSDYGETVQTWQTFAIADAAIAPLTAREFFKAQQVQFDVSHKVTIRYLPGLNSTMRVVFGERILHIESIFNPDERNIVIELLCKE